MILEQRTLLDSYHLSLEGSDLKYKKKSLMNYTERLIPIENLNLRGYSITRQFDINAFIIGGCIICAIALGIGLLTEGLKKNENLEILSAGVLFVLSLGGIVYGLNQIRVRVYIYSTTGITLDFFHDKPNKEKVDDFIINLKQTQKKIFIDRYGNYDNLMPIQDQINNLAWLRNNNFLTHEEYEEKRKLFTSSDKKIGY